LKKFKWLYPATIAACMLPALTGIAAAVETNASQSKLERQTKRGELAQQAAKLRAEAKKSQRLTEAKLKSCQAREASIATLSTNFTAQVNRQLGVFDKIAERAQDFAVTKNRQPDNLADLVQKLTDKRQQVVDDLKQFSDNAAAFKCEGENPKALGKALLADAKVVRSSLKDYRESVRELIQAIKKTKADKPQDSAGSDDDSNDDNSTGGAL
jgi:chromosome segregation ATPase